MKRTRLHRPRRERCTRGVEPADARRTILGVSFFAGDSEQAAALGLRGGLVVIPSAPALVEIVRDREYREATRLADLVLTDSGFMVVIWRLLTGERLRRTSGLRYLKLLLASPELIRQHETAAWIMPSLSSVRRALRWSRAARFPITLDDCYIAPSYPLGPVEDPDLLDFIRARRPHHVFIALGGGTQEKVGLYLRRHLDWVPGIHCIGAAIGFLTGDQVSIPDWADRCYLGWLFRCWDRPSRFVPRYWRSGKLAWLLWKYRDACPVALEPSR